MLGETLIRARDGPTLAGVRRFLAPAWYARGRGGLHVTDSGAYYVVFAYPRSLFGDKAFALHVADGSQIVTRRSDGPRLTIYVGGGAERYGSCHRRLGGPRLAGGYLPILETTYVDSEGVRYRQESFAGRAPNMKSLVSFVRLAVDARHAKRHVANVMLSPSEGSSVRLVTDGRGTVRQSGVRFRVHGTAVLYAAWVHQPRTGIAANAAVYSGARRRVVSYWTDELARGTVFEVPEHRVMDAQRNLLIQQRVLTWRYSIGNNYEELSFAEALDAAQVMAEYGHADVTRAILRFALRRLPQRYTNWRAGALLATVGRQLALTGDIRFTETHVADLEAVLDGLEGQVHRRGGSGLLDRERFSTDVARRVLGLHSQAIAWHGLVAIARAWELARQPLLARRATLAAKRLGRALQTAVVTSRSRLPDGSIFVPAGLLDPSTPFQAITKSRDGTYWNLVMPYVLASGLFDPTRQEAQGIWRYIRLHGGRLLGLVRADANRLYRGEPYPAGGVDQVYGLNMSRFLADADIPDQLVLSLYGTLGGALTPGTFIGGETTTIAPLQGRHLRSMYLPPNGGTNTTFLETLRVSLIHERHNEHGLPIGLDLAFATPRGWLAPGNTIRVRNAPTSFGPLSYAMTRRQQKVELMINAPPTPSLRIRIRLPRDANISNVATAGQPVSFDPATGTMDVTGRQGQFRVTADILPRGNGKG